MISFINLGSNKAARSKFEEVDSFFIPNFSTVGLQNSINNVSDLQGISKREIVEHSALKSKVLTIKGRKLLAYITSIKNNTVGLFTYDADNAAFAGQDILLILFHTKLGISQLHLMGAWLYYGKLTSRVGLANYVCLNYRKIKLRQF